MDVKEVKKLVLPPSAFEANGDRADRARHKAKLLGAVLATGNRNRALEQAGISDDSLARYLQDGVFADNLRKIEDHLAATLTAVAINKANAGDNDMIKFVLPALNDRFDSGIRKARAMGEEKMKTSLFQRLLEQSGQDTETVRPYQGSTEPTIEVDNTESIQLLIPDSTKPEPDNE